jgi:hypothetical protein
MWLYLSILLVFKGIYTINSLKIAYKIMFLIFIIQWVF